MSPELLEYLCEPVTKAPLTLRDATYGEDGSIQAGSLVTPTGTAYPIVAGVPRFLSNVQTDVVTVASTFGSPAAFRGKVVVDAGGGGGAQTKWFAEHGAARVIPLAGYVVE
jgi:uncharacterized protein YbaR (Trm112 family)